MIRIFDTKSGKKQFEVRRGSDRATIHRYLEKKLWKKGGRRTRTRTRAKKLRSQNKQTNKQTKQTNEKVRPCHHTQVCDCNIFEREEKEHEQKQELKKYRGKQTNEKNKQTRWSDCVTIDRYVTKKNIERETKTRTRTRTTRKAEL